MVQRQDGKALVGERKLLVHELVGVDTVAANHSALAFLVQVVVVSAVESEEHHAIERDVSLHVFEYLAEHVLYRHVLEELVLVVVKHTELLLLDVVLRRDKALEIERVERARDVRECLGSMLVERVRIKRIHHEGAHTVLAAVEHRDSHYGLDHRVVDVVEQGLAARKVTFEQAVHVHTEQLTQETRSLGNLHVRSYLCLGIGAGVCANTPFLHGIEGRKQNERVHVRDNALEPFEHVAEGLLHVGIGAGPHLVYAQCRTGLVVLGSGIVEGVLEFGSHRRRKPRSLHRRAHHRERCSLSAGNARQVHIA